MLFYEYSIRDEFDSIQDYAETLKGKFEAGMPPDDLLRDRDSLTALCFKLLEQLPPELRETTNLRRHLAWMKTWLDKGMPNSCYSDIQDICNSDIPDLEKAFREWCKNAVFSDQELAEKVQNLLIQREYDSAIRRAFVILKARLVTNFNLSDKLDGQQLVNDIFGTKGLLRGTIDQDECQGMRDLLAGLYSLFRNKYGHNDVEPPYHEANAILSTINYALEHIKHYHV